MAFEHFIPHPFTPAGIQMYAPAASGLYGISNSREWIYIGQTDNIQNALLVHLRDPQAPLMQRAPTGFVFEACAGPLLPSRQDRLVQEYEPVCNRQGSR